MHVLSACPLRVASLVWQPRPGAFALTVVCKATYVLAPGTAPLAAVQEEPHALDACWSDDPRASLCHAGDLAPFKRRADVLLVGHAYAPGGQPVAALVARLVAGEIDKEIAVHGDRFFTFDGHLGEPSRFTRMPLRWERAAGGPDTPNPVGISLDALPDRLGRVLVPNLQPPEVHVDSLHDAIQPVGFGPLAPSWPGRRAHLHRHAASWDHARWHERPLPDDIDAGYFNAAPLDQQTSDIAPHARLVLTNLHPDHARLVTSLQPIVPRAVCSTGSGPAQEVRLRCDTLCIDTDRAVVSLTWRGIVQLDHPAQVGQVVVTAEGALAGASLPVRGSPAAKAAVTASIDVASVQTQGALPFAPGSGLPSSLSRPRALALPELARAHARLGGTADLDPAIVRASGALPFASTPRPPEPVAVPMIAELPAPPPLMALHPAPEPAPVARPEAPVPAPPPTPEPQSAAAEPEPEPPGPPPLPLDAYPIERCAGIAASIARRRSDRAAILEKNDLDEEVWGALEGHWAEALRGAAARGKTAPLRAYDEAYVAQLEAERGAITAEEYARVMVAAERGTEKDVLAELGLPRGALLRVQRVWLKKMGASKELGRRVREAMEAAREA